jgi:hypothetical protein
MNQELKKAIVNYMFDNAKQFQLLNSTINEFRQYIYTPKGEYIIGGKEVSEFINLVDREVINFQLKTK